MEEITLPIAILLLSLLVGSLPVTAAPTKDAAANGAPGGATKDANEGGHSVETQDGNSRIRAATTFPATREIVDTKCPSSLTEQKDAAIAGGPAVSDCSVTIGDSPTATGSSEHETAEKASGSEPDDLEAKPAVCPSFCECANQEMHCSRANLNTVPNDLDRHTTYLDLGHNHITALQDDDLASRGLTHLTSLILDNNKISAVSQHAFRGLTKLSLLQLAGNLIGHLHPNIFQGNVELKHIDLTGNPLTFSTEGPIFYTKSLEWVDLDQCNLTSLPTEAFHDMPGLRYVNLNGNHIRTLHLSQFSKMGYLRYVKLLGNPLQCDCDMKPLWRWFTQQSINADGRCVAPSNGSVTLRKYFETLECKK